MSENAGDGWSCFAFQIHSTAQVTQMKQPDTHWFFAAVSCQRKLWQLPRGMILPQLVSILKHGTRDAPFAKPGFSRLQRLFMRTGLRLLHLALVLPLAAERVLAKIWSGQSWKNRTSGS